MQLSQLNEDVGGVLKTLYGQDQAERKRYQAYLAKYPDWRVAAKQYAVDFKRDLDDVFDDVGRLKKAKELIFKNIEQIKKSKGLIGVAWLLVQHMDRDVKFQVWFVKHLRKGSTEQQYLTDRILVNNGKPQKYGTQT